MIKRLHNMLARNGSGGLRTLARLLIIAVLCGLGILNPQASRAQTGAAGVYLQSTSTTPVQSSSDGVPALQVHARFTLLDASGVPTNAEIDRVELQVGQDRYTGTFGKPSGVWAISILLDNSGTLANTTDYRRIIEGLAKSLDAMPQNALFTIIAFNNTTSVVMDFTSDKEAVRKQLLTLNAQAGTKSCLNDGLLEAVRRVGQASAHSAVIAVTASEDNCGDTSVQTIVDQANSSGTQIHALGITGYSITLNDLKQYTQPTHGLAYMRSPNDLLFGLNNLLSGLSYQWEANWTIYPHKGDQTVPIRVILKDASVLKGQITFTSDKDYVPPPTVNLVGEIRSTPGNVLVNLNIVNAAKIAALKVRIIDKRTGQAILDQVLPSVQQSLALPANSLTKGGAYTLEIIALDAQNNVLAQTPPTDFTYAPSSLQIAIATVSAPTMLSPQFVVTITTSTGDVAGIARYKAWLETEQSNGPIPNTEVFQSPDTPLVIPAGNLPGGTYLVKAQALDGANQVLAELTKPYTVEYDKPSFVDVLLYNIGQSSVAVVGLGLLAVIALVALFFMLRFARTRSQVAAGVVDAGLPERVHTKAPPDDSSHVLVQIDQAPEAAGAGGSAVIIVREPATLNFQAHVTGPQYTIGRNPGNSAVLTVGAQSGVSGRHATIVRDKGAWYIQDNNSTNGTFINGRKLPSGSRARLADHVLIGLGPKVKLEFRIQP